MKYKKILATVGSVLMLGATMAGAFAASYPVPFSSGAVVVVGANAAASDMTAATNINSDLSGKLVADTGAVSVEGGDSYKLEKTSVKLHIGDNVVASIRASLADDQLPTLLAEGTYIDDDNDEFDYTQKIDLGNTLNVSMWEDNDYAEDEPTIGYRIVSGADVLNYTLTFSDQPLVTDLPTTTLPIMGKSYYVLANGSTGANMILTLLDSATDAVLNEGETTTLVVGSNSYVVSIAYVSATEVKLSVNGETTNSLAELATYKLSDGSYIGIKDILYNAKETGISSVEFSIGKGKLKLTSGSEVQVNDQAVPGLESVITNSSGAISSSTIALSSIKLVWKADEDLFLTEDSELVIPQFETVKLLYTGVSYPAEEVIEIRQGGDSYAVLEDFPLKDGPADIAFLYGAAGGPFSGIGKDANSKLITSNTSTITFDADSDEYFIVSYAATSEGESYLMRATNFVLDGTANETDIQYYKDGVWTDKQTGRQEGDTFSVGNAELGIGFINRAGKSVVITANSTATNFWHLYSKEGLRTYLPFASLDNGTSVPGEINLTGGALTVLGANGTTFFLQFAEEDKDGNIGAGPKFNVSVGWDASTTPEVEVKDLTGENTTTNIEIQDTDVERAFMYSALATEFLFNKPTSGQDSIKIIYHGDEVEASTYVVSSTASAVSEVGTMVATDAETAKITSKNLIVVGGSCINSVAANLLGGALCGEAFTASTGVGAGQFLIQSFAREGKVALLVAGYDAADTTKAATYLVNNAVDTAVGAKTIKSSTVTADTE